MSKILLLLCLSAVAISGIAAQEEMPPEVQIMPGMNKTDEELQQFRMYLRGQGCGGGCGGSRRCFKCPGGGCIPQHNHCDGLSQCRGGYDELFCNRRRRRRTCGGGDRFRCRNRQCIPMGSTCNGLDDCGDYSDEDDCDYGDEDFYGGRPNQDVGIKCSDNERACVTQVDSPWGGDKIPVAQKCIHWSYFCNRVNDCGDGYDEQNCGAPCATGEIRCKNPQVNNIPNPANKYCVAGFVCNGIEECEDKSDEGASMSCGSARYFYGYK